MNAILLSLLLSAAVPKESIRFQYINAQGFDASCGYSTASSLLKLYWNIPVNEMDLVVRFIPDKIERDDYETNLAELMLAIKDAGLACKSYKMEINQLKKAVNKYAPLIVHYSEPEEHFALLLAIRDGWFITADPSRGLEALTENQFKDRFSGALMLVASSTKEKNKELLEKAVTLTIGKKESMELWAEKRFLH